MEFTPLPGTLISKRRELVEAAVVLFAKYGYHGTTIEQIAGATGISIGSIYRYVGRKQDILLLIFRELADQYEAELAPLKELDLPPAQKLAEAVRRYYRVIDRQPNKALIAYRESWVLDKEALAYVMRRELDCVQHVEYVIQEGIDRGEFREPENLHLLAYNLLMLGHMWALKGWHLRRRMSVDEYARQQTAWVLALLGSRP